MNKPFQHHTSLGSADWGSPDGKVLKPFRPGQFLVGYDENGKAIGSDDDRHAGVVCMTRGGKGVSIIVPNLISYPGSVVVIDPKGENAMVTARRRGSGNQFTSGMGQKVHILDPMGEVSTRFDDFNDLRAAYNPLSLIDASRPGSVDVAARIADSFIHGESSENPYWSIDGKKILKFVSLHLATSPDFTDAERNLAKVYDLLLAGLDTGEGIFEPGDKNKPSGIELLFMSMTRNRAFNGVIAMNGRYFLMLAKTSPKQFMGVLSYAASSLEFLSSDAMRACVSKTTFSLSDLKTEPRGMSLYICLPDRDLGTHYGWLRMMVSLIVAEMERVKDQPATGHRVWMILDEFPALKRMTVLENAAAKLAGAGVKLVLIVQTLAQLKDLYKDNWETLLGSCGTKLFFCNDDHFTREHVSRLIGEHEVLRSSGSSSSTSGSNNSESRNEGGSETTGGSVQKTPNREDSRSRSSGVGKSTSQGQSKGSSQSRTSGTSESVHKRALITPDEVGRSFGSLSNPLALVLVSGFQPITLKRFPYFNMLGLAGHYDYHRDHPVPLTRYEANKLRAERKREDEAREKERVRKAEEARQLRERNARAEAARRAAEQAERQAQYEAACRREDRKRVVRIWIACIVVLIAMIAASWVLYFYWQWVLGVSLFVLWLWLIGIDKDAW